MNPRDIGNVYKRNGNFFIAVRDFTLLTYRNNKFYTYTTDEKHTFVKGISVKRLCKKWKISVKQLDQEMRKYFAPDAEAQERVKLEKLKDLDLIYSGS